jgi:hypothetical protein
VVPSIRPRGLLRCVDDIAHRGRVRSQLGLPCGITEWWRRHLVVQSTGRDGATLYWFVRQVRRPIACLLVGVILVALSVFMVVDALAKLPGDPDGVLYTAWVWQVAIALSIVVGVTALTSRERKAEPHRPAASPKSTVDPRGSTRAPCVSQILRRATPSDARDPRVHRR